MIVSMIAAMAEDRVIGSAEGKIPWNLPRDQSHFRNYTEGKWVLAGRKTYEEMTDWFAGRIPVVLTGRPDYEPPHIWHRVTSGVPDAIRLAKESGAGELVVIGGGSVYEAALPFADRLVLTRIDASFPIENPVRFPDFAAGGRWKLVAREEWPPDSENPHAMALEIFDRNRGN